MEVKKDVLVSRQATPPTVMFLLFVHCCPFLLYCGHLCWADLKQRHLVTNDRKKYYQFFNFIVQTTVPS